MVRCAVSRVTFWVFLCAVPTELSPRTLVERRGVPRARLDTVALRFVPVNVGGGGTGREAHGVVGRDGLEVLLSFRRCAEAGGGGTHVLRSPCESRLMNRVSPLPPVCRRQVLVSTSWRRRRSASQLGSNDHRRTSFSPSESPSSSSNGGGSKPSTSVSAFLRIFT